MIDTKEAAERLENDSRLTGEVSLGSQRALAKTCTSKRTKVGKASRKQNF